MSLAAGVPAWFVAVLVGVAAAAAYAAYSRPVVPLSAGRRAVLTALRLAALLLLLLLLLEPVATEPGPASDAVVPVLLDNSRSMRLPDGHSARRIDRAVALVRDEILPALADRFDVEVVTLDAPEASADPDAVEPTAPRTDLVAALEAIARRYEGRTVAGIVVLSDGVDTSGRDLPRVVESGAGPVYAVGIGLGEAFPDREVTSLMAGNAAVVESVVQLSAEVVVRGSAGEASVLRLFEDGRLVEVRCVGSPGEGVAARAVFQVSPRPDVATLYTVEVAAAPAEPALENNRRSVLVQPPGRPRRVLMIEGSPGHEHSFLKRSWLSDRGVALDAVVRKGQNARGQHTFYVQGDPRRTPALAAGYPRDRRALFRYDAVIFANVEAGFFQPAQLAMTAEFVAERGGGLLLLGSTALAAQGLRGSALEAVVPLELSDRERSVSAAGRFANRNRLLLTNDGAVHPMMQLGATVDETRERWGEVPALAGSTSLGAARPGASVLALVGRPEGGSGPLIAVQRYGRGRSMVFAGEAAWRWKMLMPAESRIYDTFWRQVARWLTALAPERLTLSVASTPAPGDPVEIGLQVLDAEYRPVADAAPVIEVTTPTGVVHTVDAVLADRGSGRYAARLRAELDGVYRVEAWAGEDLAPVTEWFLVGGADEEFADPRADAQVLERLATAAGGTLLAAGEVRQLRGLLAAAAPAPEPLVRALWHGAWSFLLVLAVLTVEWSLRRAWGMR